VSDTATLKQLVLGRKDVQDLSDNETELPPDLMTVNMGPSHPAMHGTVRIVLTVDGARVPGPSAAEIAESFLARDRRSAAPAGGELHYHHFAPVTLSAE